MTEVRALFLGEPGPYIRPPVQPVPEKEPPIRDEAALTLTTDLVTTPVEVVGTLGEGESWQGDPNALKPFTSWMGVSTNFKSYPDAAILGYARWAVENTAGFTLVVSDWLNRYNWVAERGDWNAFDEGKHIDRLEQAADRRIERFQQIFAERGINADVIAWSQMIRKIIEQGFDNDVQGAMSWNLEWQSLDHSAQHKPDFRTELEAVHQRLVPHLIERGVKKGHHELFMNNALMGYTMEEVLLTSMMAETRFGTIKIGPKWERPYDEVTAKWVRGDYFNSEREEHIPFGAVYLRPKSFTAQEYGSLVEHTADPRLDNYMQKETAFIEAIPDIKAKTVVDLGAGHGRMIDDLAQAARNVVAIEINADMYKALQERAANHSNATAIRGDVLTLPILLDGQDIEKPVFVIAQNSLGTLEGNAKALLQTVANVARQHNGELVLSLLRQPALEDWGLNMYKGLESMVGEIDEDQTDTQRGRFISKTGYQSKWWTDSEIEELKTLGTSFEETREAEFCILRLKF